MDDKRILLNKLLDKYEKSKAVYKESNRKIRIKMDELAEYDIEDYEKKRVFHDVVKELEKEGVIEYSWRAYEKRKYFTRNMVKERKDRKSVSISE